MDAAGVRAAARLRGVRRAAEGKERKDMHVIDGGPDIRIAFFDIDGTLLTKGAQRIRPAVAEALRRLRAGGVRLFLCTGRPTHLLPPFDEVPFDGAVCFNGSRCYDRERVLYSNPMRTEDVLAVTERARSLGLPVMISTLDRMGSDIFSEALDEYASFSGRSCVVFPDFDMILRGEDVYQMMIGTLPEQDFLLTEGIPGAKALRWWTQAVDIVPSECGKADGMARVLEAYGLDRSQCVAFGDGGNDIDMLRFAGIGVAMGNAAEEVRACADLVTDSCEEDGIRTALFSLGLLRD